MQEHVPSKIVKHIRPKNPVVTPAIEKAIKEKRAAFRRLKHNPSAANRNAFKLQRNLVTHLLRKAERAHATSLYRAQRLQSSPSTYRNF